MMDEIEEIENGKKVNKVLRDSLKDFFPNRDLSQEYEEWVTINRFDSVLYVKKPLDKIAKGDRFFFDINDERHLVNLETFKLIAFYSKSLLDYERSTIESVLKEKGKKKKRIILQNYFDFIDKCLQDKSVIPVCTNILNDFAEKQAVLYGSVQTKPVDFCVCLSCFCEILRKESIESIYLLFTKWRLNKENRDLNILVDSIAEYLRFYFYIFEGDPFLDLEKSLDNKPIIVKINTIVDWLDRITLTVHTNVEKYEKLGWLYPDEKFVDLIVPTNKISNYELYLYRVYFAEDTDETVIKKAMVYHNFVTWKKTADLISIVSDINKIIGRFSTREIKNLYVSKEIIMKISHNCIRIRDYYIESVFSNRASYIENRRRFDPEYLELIETNADLFSDSFDDVITMTNAFLGDSIDDLVQAKQQYIKRLNGFITEEQEKALDELTNRNAEKIKASLQKLTIYDELHSNIAVVFEDYSSMLMKHPKLLTSLVSAEYLYQQYIVDKAPNENFDYSCISIMYYLALEDFVNRLLYTPYSKDVLSGIGQNEWKGYVSHRSAFWHINNKSYKLTSELGNLGFLLAKIQNEPHLKAYLKSKNNNLDFDLLAEFGEKLKIVAPRRNEAAHGGNIISYQNAVIDKNNVFKETADEYRGLILELLRIIVCNHN